MKNKIRGFEKLTTIKADIPIPTRGTALSAGYDIYVIHPDVYKALVRGKSVKEAWDAVPKFKRTVRRHLFDKIMLPTGIKAYMLADEYLKIHIRSSSAVKEDLKIDNDVPIIDADYYNNISNEGHIMIPLSNWSIKFDEPFKRICQGIFTKYLVADNDNASQKRIGGVGSTND